MGGRAASSAGPDGRISLRHTIDPGSGIDDAIAVSNLGTAPATYTVAPGDGILGDSGAFDIAAGDPQDRVPGSPSTDWMPAR